MSSIEPDRSRWIALYVLCAGMLMSYQGSAEGSAEAG